MESIFWLISLFSFSSLSCQQINKPIVKTTVPEKNLETLAVATPYCNTPSMFTVDNFKSKCGTFVKYDPVNNRTDPEYYGVPSGFNYKDETVTYVGYGSGKGCSIHGMPMENCIGYISTTSGSAGFYSTCTESLPQIFDTSTAFFLLW